MDLLSYVRALRRRWFVIVVCAVLGLALGYGTTLLNHDSGSGSKDHRTYYQATNTVVVDFSSAQQGLAPAYTNLDQIALVVTTGAVPDQVAAALKTPEPGRVLAQHVTTTTDSLTNTLQITVVDPNRDRAAKLADTFAAKLDDVLQATDQQRYETALDDLNGKIATLKQQSDALLAQLKQVPPPPDVDTIQRQYDATQNTYYSRFSQLQQTSAAGPAQTSVTVLQAAEPDPISATQFANALALGATDQNHIRLNTGDTTSTTTPTGTASSAFNGPVGRAFAGGFLGLLIGIGIVLLLDRLDRRVRTREEVEQAFELPVLAEIPRLSRKDQAEDSLVTFSAPLSRVAEAFRAIRTSLVFQQSMISESASANGNGNGNGYGNGHASGARDVSEPLVVMVTSAAPREGKSTTSANLAVAFAEGGASVLVVNCDFRRPAIHRRFGVFDEPRRVQDTKVPGVKIVTNVLTDAAANPSQVVAAQRQVIAAARGRFDVIVLDTAPMLTANDAVGIVSSVDFVLLVAQVDMTTTDNAHRVMELLSRVHASVSGIALIGSADASNEYYYYYQRERLSAKGVTFDHGEDATGPEAARQLLDTATPSGGTPPVPQEPSEAVAHAGEPTATGTSLADPAPTPGGDEPAPPAPDAATAPRDVLGESPGTA
jgi:Mrp family chromosome partitioning ATPase/capsular polysaccharide biosynthesis protein